MASCGALAGRAALFVGTCLVPVAEAAPADDDLEDAIPIRVGRTIKANSNGATEQRGEARAQHASALALP